MLSRGPSGRSSVKVNDIRIHYEVRGDGFPLVMIMGLGANMDWWDPRMIEALSKDFRLVLFDNRGAGRTEASSADYTMRLFADDAVGLMDILGIPRAHVFGISMGGMIAQELALNHPTKVERLVLCSTNCGGSRSVPASPEARAMLGSMLKASSAEEVAGLAARLCFTQALIDAHKDDIHRWIQRTLVAPMPRDVFMRQLGAILNFDTYGRLAGIEAPTLVLHGKRDILIPAENAPVLAEAIPHARLRIFEDSAHGLAEEIDEVSAAARKFLLESA